jgi:hypothetical protein
LRNRIGEDAGQSRAPAHPLLIGPHVERRLAERGVFEEIAGADVCRFGKATGGDRGLETIEVDDEACTRDQTKPFAVLGKDIVTDCCPEPMKCLPKCVPGLVLVNPAPEEIDNLFAANLAADGKQTEEGERFSPAEAGWRRSRGVS